MLNAHPVKYISGVHHLGRVLARSHHKVCLTWLYVEERDEIDVGNVNCLEPVGK